MASPSSRPRGVPILAPHRPVPAGLNRRALLASALALALTPVPAAAATARSAPKADPFRLGVASGDPLPDSIVLWTRLAPRPYEPMGGLQFTAYPVQWQLAADEAFTQLVRDGTTTARPEYGHSVHVDVQGLRPDREYFYRFRSGGHLSPTGRTRTAPAAGSSPQKMRFAFASCQNYTDGYYTAYQHLVEEDVSVVFFLGDYIYEGAVNATAGNRHDDRLALPDVFELACDSLDLYRLRYALYRTDPDLQAAHAAFPWVLTWDDHEVSDNYAGAASRFELPAADFLVQRANAYRAYWENQPLRRPQRPSGAAAQLFRRLRFGDLAEAHVLDTRQYRSDQVCGDGLRAGCGQRDDPDRTIMGSAQRGWLLDGLASSDARWNILVQQVMMTECRDERGRMDMDKWDGYTADRHRVLETAAHVPGTVVISGDIHLNYASDLPADFTRPDAPAVAVELIGTSVTSGGNGSESTPLLDQQLLANPYLKFANAQRGYVRCELTRDTMRADYRVVPAINTISAPISTRVSLVSERDRPGLTT